MNLKTNSQATFSPQSTPVLRSIVHCLDVGTRHILLFYLPMPVSKERTLNCVVLLVRPPLHNKILFFF